MKVQITETRFYCDLCSAKVVIKAKTDDPPTGWRRRRSRGDQWDCCPKHTFEAWSAHLVGLGQLAPERDVQMPVGAASK